MKLSSLSAASPLQTSENYSERVHLVSGQTPDAAQSRLHIGITLSHIFMVQFDGEVNLDVGQLAVAMAKEVGDNWGGCERAGQAVVTLCAGAIKGQPRGGCQRREAKCSNRD